MPGGGLIRTRTPADRAGPADGLADAEIAGRLDRPTSTITREVMRNGGPTAYRADPACRLYSPCVSASGFAGRPC